MKRRTTFLLAALTLVAQPACTSGYRAQRAAIDSYTPPQLYRSLAGAAPAPASPPAAEEDRFAAAAQGVKAAASAWEESIGRSDAATSFLVPAASLLRDLAGAATDAGLAGAALGDGFSLPTLETLVLLRNPMIRAKAAETRAALEVFGQAEQIDTVLRSYAALTASSMPASGGMGAAPDFPFPAVLALKGQIVGEEVRAASERLEAARRDAVTAARTAWWELVYVVQAAEIAARMSELLESLGGSVSSRYEAGQTSFQDVVRVRIEREKIREELKTLADERKNREAEIRGLLSLPPDIAVGSPASGETQGPLPEQQALESLALERRQEVREADAMIGRMERMLEMVETMTYPGFDLGLSPAARGIVAPAPGGAGMAGPADGPGLAPLPEARAPQRPFFAADEAYLREIRLRIAALAGEREAVRAETLVGVRNAWFAADRARREEALYATKVLGLSQSALEASLQGYTAGKVAFSDLLESYAGWLEASLARERARADIGIARAGLAAAVGVSDIEGNHDETTRDGREPPQEVR